MKRCAICRTPAAAAAPSAALPALLARHPHRGGHRWGMLAHLAQVVPEVPREVVERATRRRDVHEAEEGCSQLLVRRRQLHRALVEGTQRVAPAGGQRGVDRRPTR